MRTTTATSGATSGLGALRGAAGVPAIDIGIDALDRKLIADGLANVVADAQTLCLKTRGYHWNVVGPLHTEHAHEADEVMGPTRSVALDPRSRGRVRR